MPNKDYWIKRQEDLQNSLMDKAEDYTAEIEKGYTAAIKELEKQIAVWYQRFADNNGIDIVTAQRILNEKELAELKWDVQEYIKHGKENALDGRWMKELENASARVHISRLEALKLQARQQIEQLYGGREQSVRELTGNAYKGTLYGTGYEHFCRTGIETYFDRIDENKLNQILNKAWTVDGKNFSERIWDNKQKLINTLNNEFVRALTTGESPDKLSANIAKTMKADKSSAQTLVLTESAYFATKGQTDCYVQLDVEEYEILETLDSTTCEVCGSYDGKHYPVKSMHAGVNAPPFHPRCRGTTIPYFDDEFTEDEKRATRGQDGKTKYVDNMTFEEWKEKYVDGENENATKADYNNIENSKVNWDNIKSQKWIENINQITDNQKVNVSIKNIAEQILKHRDGTFKEDLYFIDGDTGHILGFNTTSNQKLKVSLNESMIEALNDSSVGQIIGIHNHPYSSIPSLSDLNVLVKRAKQNIGIIICHNGTIFVYTKPSVEIREMDYQVALTKYKIYSKMTCEDKGFADLGQDYDFEFRRLET